MRFNLTLNQIDRIVLSCLLGLFTSITIVSSLQSKSDAQTNPSTAAPLSVPQPPNGSLPNEALPAPPVLPPSPTSSPTSLNSTQDQRITIPNDSALVVFFPNELRLSAQRKAKQQHDLPLVLPLVQPILDEQGNIAIPARSLVSALVTQVEGGIYIRANSVVVGGMVIPIEATGAFIPLQNSPDDFYNYATKPPSLLNNLATNLSTWSTSAEDVFGQDGSLAIGAGLALVSGLTTPQSISPPPTINIPQGTVHILTLTTSLQMPATLVRRSSQTIDPSGSLIPEPDPIYSPAPSSDVPSGDASDLISPEAQESAPEVPVDD
jgi:hypothetical protein